MGHTSTRLPELTQVFKCTNITSGSKTVLIHASTESRTEFSTRLSQLESFLVQSCQRGVPPEVVSKRNDSFGVSKFATKEKADSPSGYTLPLVHHFHRPYKWFFIITLPNRGTPLCVPRGTLFHLNSTT